MTEIELIPLSALNQYAYCPRRCYLIHAEGEFVDNVHTLRGSHEHERVDQLQHEVSAGVRVEYSLPVWSQRLGLTGRCDVVEFHPDGSVYPVEYKHGKRKRWMNDDLQLAAQALCLEETLGQPVAKGRDLSPAVPPAPGGGHRCVIAAGRGNRGTGGAPASHRQETAATGGRPASLPGVFAARHLPARSGTRLRQACVAPGGIVRADGR